MTGPYSHREDTPPTLGEYDPENDRPFTLHGRWAVPADPGDDAGTDYADALDEHADDNN